MKQEVTRLGGDVRGLNTKAELKDEVAKLQSAQLDNADLTDKDAEAQGEDEEGEDREAESGGEDMGGGPDGRTRGFSLLNPKSADMGQTTSADSTLEEEVEAEFADSPSRYPEIGDPDIIIIGNGDSADEAAAEIEPNMPPPGCETGKSRVARLPNPNRQPWTSHELRNAYAYRDRHRSDWKQMAFSFTQMALEHKLVLAFFVPTLLLAILATLLTALGPDPATPSVPVTWQFQRLFNHHVVTMPDVVVKYTDAEYMAAFKRGAIDAVLRSAEVSYDCREIGKVFL